LFRREERFEIDRVGVSQQLFQPTAEITVRIREMDEQAGPLSIVRVRHVPVDDAPFVLR